MRLFARNVLQTIFACAIKRHWSGYVGASASAPGVGLYQLPAEAEFALLLAGGRR